jgi:Fe-S-cluster containining protein
MADYVNRHPFGMDPSEDQIADAVAEAKKVYEGIPATTCDHRVDCCSAGCPNMYYNEFLAIRRGVVDKMSKKERIDLTIGCVQRYLQHQLELKPCVFLKDNMCSVYEHRHLKCRLYGLIPDSLYSWITKTVADDMQVDRKCLPLCNQCQFVKVAPEDAERFPDGKVPESDIKKMEKRLISLDKKLGMKKEIQEDGFGFLTYHDWHLLFEFGEEWMEKLTQLRINLKEKQKEQFVESLKNALESKLEG